MAAVNAQVEVITRGGDPTQHQLENDYTQTFQLTSTDSSYSTDTSAFATTVYNYYNGQLSANTATEQVSTVELRWKVWIGGSAVSGGVTTNEGEFGTVNNASDLQTELNSHIAHALSGDQAQPGL